MEAVVLGMLPYILPRHALYMVRRTAFDVAFH